MMKWHTFRFGFLLFVSGLFSGHSFAQNSNVTMTNALALEPVTSTSLKLLGRGIQNKSTDESVALACVGDKSKNTSIEAGCDELRFVYYKNANEVYYIGTTYHVESMSFEQAEDLVAESVRTERKVYKTVKSKEIFNYEKASQEEKQAFMRTVDRRQTGHRYILGGLVVIGYASAIKLILIGAVSPLAGGILMMAGIVYAMKYMSKRDDKSVEMRKKERVVRNVKVTYYKAATIEVFNQNGWNWAEDPARISNKKFNRLIEAIQSTLAPAQ